VIAALLFLAMVGWSCWWMFRDVRSPGETTPSAAPTLSATPTTNALGLEDDLDQWRAVRGAWTALDERQLTRLLNDASRANRPATNSINNAVPQVEHEDTR
jgi:hypothetical protein